jgi:hypothetical protein
MSEPWRKWLEKLRTVIECPEPQSIDELSIIVIVRVLPVDLQAVLLREVMTTWVTMRREDLRL